MAELIDGEIVEIERDEPLPLPIKLLLPSTIKLDILQGLSEIEKAVVEYVAHSKYDGMPHAVQSNLHEEDYAEGSFGYFMLGLVPDSTFETKITETSKTLETLILTKKRLSLVDFNSEILATGSLEIYNGSFTVGIHPQYIQRVNTGKIGDITAAMTGFLPLGIEEVGKIEPSAVEKFKQKSRYHQFYGGLYFMHQLEQNGVGSLEFSRTKRHFEEVIKEDMMAKNTTSKPEDLLDIASGLQLFEEFFPASYQRICITLAPSIREGLQVWGEKKWNAPHDQLINYLNRRF
tara:strand:- start:253 stop:1122 length:870 start_codon:yes stop_codon:yes gene_type:complete